MIWYIQNMISCSPWIPQTSPVTLYVPEPWGDDHLEFFPDGMGSRDTDHFTDESRLNMAAFLLN